MGRRPVYTYSYLGFTAFSWGYTFAPNFPAFVIFRFLCGVCGSSTLNNQPASIGDVGLWIRTLASDLTLVP